MGTLVADCPHCPATHVAFPTAWCAPTSVASNIYNGVSTCPACHRPICFQTTVPQSSAPNSYGGVINERYGIKAIWPGRAVSKAPAHTPEPVRRRFIEGEEAYRRHSWNAAVAMYRSALDIATKGLNGVPPGLTFFKRLEWLHNEHRITPDIRSWADHVRVEGNEALHDPEDFSQEDAKPLRLFTEMFLRYVFELPGEVRAFRGEVEAELPAAT